MKSTVKRSVRMAEAVRETLSRVLLMEARDPRVQGVVITAVRLTADLRDAKIYFVIEGGADAARRASALEGLERTKGFLRSALGSAIKARHIPDLRFFFDESIETGARIEEVLAEIRSEDEH